VKKPLHCYVADSSIAIAWCLADEKNDYSEAALDALKSNRAIVPDLWHLEAVNALLVAERRKRATSADTLKSLTFLSRLRIDVDDQTRHHAFGTTTNLARTHNLSSYDAVYLELAMRRGLQLATLDGKLKAAAKAVGVSLWTP
jgi:predicted nucleic acid-binding protein